MSAAAYARHPHLRRVGAAVAAVVMAATLTTASPSGVADARGPAPAPIASETGRELLATLATAGAGSQIQYGVRDSAGVSMDCLRIAQLPDGSYVGVFHSDDGHGVFDVRVATSPDLSHWTTSASLASHASQPVLTRLADGGFLVAWERDTPTQRDIHLSHYPSLATLLAGRADRSFDTPQRMLGHTEGTPNFISVELRPDIDHSVIRMGFHYNPHGVDREAIGTVTDFSHFSGAPNTVLNRDLAGLGLTGNYGDRDAITFEGERFIVVEGELRPGDWSSWRTFLYDPVRNQLSQIPSAVTGATSLGNPSAMVVRAPDGRTLLVTTDYVFDAHAPAQTGEMVGVRDWADGGAAAGVTGAPPPRGQAAMASSAAIAPEAGRGAGAPPNRRRMSAATPAQNASGRPPG